MHRKLIRNLLCFSILLGNSLFGDDSGLINPSAFAVLDWTTENTLTNVSRIISDNVLLDRARGCYYVPICESLDCIPFEKNLWVAALGSHLQQDKLKHLTSFNTNGWGLIGALDFELANWLSLGIAGGYTHTSLSGALRRNNSINTFYLGPYAAWRCGRWTIEASFLKATQRFRSNERRDHRTRKNAHYGDSILVHLGTNLNYCYWDLLNFEPYLLGDYVFVHANSIKNVKEEFLRLKVGSHNMQFFQGEIGTAFSTTFKTKYGLIVPTMTVGFQSLTPINDTRFDSNFHGAPNFIVKTANETIYQWTTGFFLNFCARGYPEFSISYNAAWGDKRRTYCFAGELDWSF